LAWIESHTILLRHRKLIELAKDLRLKPVYVMGHLHALWHAALEQQEDGDLSSWSDELIAESSSYSADASQYVSLLQTHHWLDGKLLHDWLNYAGNYLARKYHNTDRDYLKTVWLKHGKHYGKRTSSRKQKGSPNQGNLILSSSQKEGEEGLGEEGTEILPEWLDQELWNDFKDHRARMPKKYHLTILAEKLALKRLGEWAGAGQDPNDIIRQSIINGWAGLFEVKNGAIGVNQKRKSEPAGFAGLRDFMAYKAKR